MIFNGIYISEKSEKGGGGSVEWGTTFFSVCQKIALACHEKGDFRFGNTCQCVNVNNENTLLFRDFNSSCEHQREIEWIRTIFSRS